MARSNLSEKPPFVQVNHFRFARHSSAILPLEPLVHFEDCLSALTICHSCGTVFQEVPM